MHIFYAPDIAHTPFLPEEESRHCVRVLRLQVGDSISIVDGEGFFYRASILDANPKRCAVLVEERREVGDAWPFALHLAISPTKNIDRMEWLYEKMTELGVNGFTPLKCRYSERKEIKLPRLEKIVISAMKQSQKAKRPHLEGMVDFKELVARPFEGCKMIAHCYPESKQLIKELYRPGEDALILIGPEGDFSPEEVAFAVAQGFLPISLGESRLRTETAALVAGMTVHLLNQ